MKNIRSAITAALLLAVVVVVGTRAAPMIPRACEPPHDGYPFCDPALPLDERLDDLVGRLTLEEKPFLLTARESPKGNISRLGIPEYDWGGNCMHGVESRCAPDGRCPTSFPNPNALGTAFNTSLWRSVGAAIGLELRALWLQNAGENQVDGLPHIGLDCWSPNLNIVRDPRWGRNMETPSEDPFLTGIYGREHVLGLQNHTDLEPRYLQAVATLKHFDANSLEGPYWTPGGDWDPVHGTISRHTVDATISRHDLASTYLPAFQEAVVNGGAAGVMCSYNRINGVPVCASEDFLGITLRDSWGFRGYVTSDSGAIDDIFIGHRFSSNASEAVRVALEAGCDVESAHWTGGHPHATGGHYIDQVPGLVRSGALDEHLVDRAVKNALEIRFRLGLFDPIGDQPLWRVPPAVVASTDHTRLAREATAQSLVLLKHERGLLPLAVSNGTTVALVGPHARDRVAMAGNYLGELCAGGGVACITSFEEGFRNATEPRGGTLRVAPGCAVAGSNTSGYAAALEAARGADVVVFVGGLDGSLEAEARDRPDARLPSVQAELLRRLAGVNPNIVLVLLHGGMVGLDAVVENVPVVVSAGYPGRYAGEVLPDVLLGETDRAWGRLAVTWYHDDFQEQFHVLDFSMTRPPGRTHRYFTGTPLFPFGHGLNPLTSFALRGLGFTKRGDTGFELRASASNTGDRAGDVVVMAFFEPPPGLPSSEPAARLKQQLWWFERVHLEAGESRELVLRSSTKALRLHDGWGRPKFYGGAYGLRVTDGENEYQTTLSINDEGRIDSLRQAEVMRQY